MREAGFRAEKPPRWKEATDSNHNLAARFFATIRGDLLDQRPWATRAQVQAAIGEWVEAFYQRRASSPRARQRQPGRLLTLNREAQAA